MSILKQDLSVSNNSLNGYFPVRTSSGDDSFDWQVAKGVVARNLYKKTLAKDLLVKEDGELSYAKFVRLCREDFSMRLDEME